MSIKTILALAAVCGGVLLVAGCSSDMADNGVSNRPQNAPSSWENPSLNINSDK